MMISSSASPNFSFALAGDQVLPTQGNSDSQFGTAQLAQTQQYRIHKLQELQLRHLEQMNHFSQPPFGSYLSSSSSSSLPSSVAASNSQWPQFSANQLQQPVPSYQVYLDREASFPLSDDSSPFQATPSPDSFPGTSQFLHTPFPSHHLHHHQHHQHPQIHPHHQHRCHQSTHSIPLLSSATAAAGRPILSPVHQQQLPIPPEVFDSGSQYEGTSDDASPCSSPVQYPELEEAYMDLQSTLAERTIKQGGEAAPKRRGPVPSYIVYAESIAQLTKLRALTALSMKSTPAEPIKKENQCANCGTKTTSLWRRGGNNECLCNACGLYYRLHRITRPVELKTDVIKKRKRREPYPKRKNALLPTAPPLPPGRLE